MGIPAVVSHQNVERDSVFISRVDVGFLPQNGVLFEEEPSTCVGMWACWGDRQVGLPGLGAWDLVEDVCFAKGGQLYIKVSRLVISTRTSSFLVQVDHTYN